MKKCISAILIMTMMVISIIGCTGSVSAESNSYCGDVNMDREISISDVTVIQKHLAKIKLLDESALGNADAYKDGKISIKDATAVQLHLVEIIDSLPKLKDATIVVKNVTAQAGESVQVPVVIHNNPGINGMQLNVSYDKDLTLSEAEKGTALSALNLTLPATYTNPSSFLWDGISDNVTDNGIVLNLTFIVPDNAKSGEKYDISVSIPEGSVYDADLNDVDFGTVKGCLTVDNNPSQSTASTHTVVFKDYNGTILNTQAVESGSSATEPDIIPVRDGYIFSHWDKSFDSVIGDLEITAVYTEISEPTVKIGNVTASAGETVEVPVTIYNNPGVNGMQLNISYDSTVVLTKAERGPVLSGLNFTSPTVYTSPSSFLWDGMDNNATDNGIVLTLLFAVPSDAESGDRFDISVEIPEGSVYDSDLNDVVFETGNGLITVS